LTIPANPPVKNFWPIVNFPSVGMEAFAKAFGCKKGDPMVREQACKIW
jgi:predicted metalloendopeptidase